VINNSWTSFYAASGYDVYTIIKIADANGQTNYKGAGLVMYVYISSVLTTCLVTYHTPRPGKALLMMAASSSRFMIPRNPFTWI